MTVAEIAVYMEAKRGQSKGDYAGGMTEADLDEIRAADAELRKKVEKARGTPSS